MSCNLLVRSPGFIQPHFTVSGFTLCQSCCVAPMLPNVFFCLWCHCLPLSYFWTMVLTLLSHITIYLVAQKLSTLPVINSGVAHSSQSANRSPKLCSGRMEAVRKLCKGKKLASCWPGQGLSLTVGLSFGCYSAADVFRGQG